MRHLSSLLLRAFLVLTIAMSFSVAAFAVNGTSVIGANAWYEQGWGRQIIIIDPTTGTFLGGRDVTGVGWEEWRVVTVATDPTTGALYAIIDDWGVPAYLATIDPATGAATLIGDTGLQIANIAFDASGMLYGITGKNADIPAALYTIDTSTGAATLACTDPLDPTGDGQAIAFNSDDGLLYHTSGTWYESPTFESLTPTDPCTQMDIPYSGDAINTGVMGMLYGGGATFLAADETSLITITTSGLVTTIGGHGFPGYEGSEYDIVRGLATTDATLTIQDVSQTASVTPAYLDAGDETVLTVNVTNNDAADATGVKTLLPVFAYNPINYVSATGDASCAMTTDGYLCDFGTIGAGMTESVDVTMAAVFEGNGYPYSYSYARPMTTFDNWDVDPQDSFEYLYIYRNTADVSIATQAPGKSPAQTGKNFTFPVTVTNSGPQSAEGVSATTSIPGSTFVSSSYPGCTGLTCNLGTLTNGQIVSYNVTVRVDLPGKSTLTNTATVTTTTYETETSNNTSTASKKVVGKP